MNGPWEQYGTAPSGPWAAYGGGAPAQSSAPDQGTMGTPEAQAALAAAATAKRTELGLPEQPAPKGDFQGPPGTLQAETATQPQSWKDVAASAVGNAVPSAQRFGGDIWHAVSNPVETGQNLWNVASGAVQKVIPGDQGNEKYADAVGSFFADRYGGIDNLKRTMATDPVGFLADAATVLTGGEMALARAPGMAGTVSRVAGTAARAVDPINATVQGAKLVGKGVGNAVSGAVGNAVSGALGVTTGAGGEAIRTAAKAGYAGGAEATAFTEGMRGTAPMEDAISSAKAGLDAIKQQRQTAYKAGMADVASDSTVLDFGKIDNALNSTQPVKRFTGKSSGVSVWLEPSAQETTGEIATVLDQWRKLPPQDFHTAEGFDALKQRLGDIRDATKPGSASNKIATQVYNIVKNQITAQAPQYAKTMAAYQQASDLIREMESTLSLNRNARVDTQLRKLQSVMRSGVNTNYGKRADLANILEANGATHLMARLGGQALSGGEPRGLARAVGAVGGLAQAGTGLAAMNPMAIVPLLAQLGMQSPRVVGEAAYGAGSLARLAKGLPDLAKGLPVQDTVRGLYQLRGAQPGRTQPQ